jgi:GNAT superfamily N-acetyltransferase
MKVSLLETRELSKYVPVIEGLIKEFGLPMVECILQYCNLLKADNEAAYQDFWKIWLIDRFIPDGHDIIGICGLYGLSHERSNNLWLGWFGIVPEYRNQGIGGKVLAMIEQKARDEKAICLRTYVDKEGKAIPFYERHGFVRQGTVLEYTRYNNFPTLDGFEDPNDHVLFKAV